MEALVLIIMLIYPNTFPRVSNSILPLSLWYHILDSSLWNLPWNAFFNSLYLPLAIGYPALYSSRKLLAIPGSFFLYKKEIFSLSSQSKSDQAASKFTIQSSNRLDLFPLNKGIWADEIELA